MCYVPCSGGWLMTVSILLVALLCTDPPKPAAVDKEELKKLQGKWSLSRREHGGEAEAGKKLKNWQVEIAGTKITARDGDVVEEELEITHLDARTKPAAINVKITKGDDKGKVVQGVWKADGKSVTICLAEPGKERPKKFEGKKETGHTVMV